MDSWRWIRNYHVSSIVCIIHLQFNHQFLNNHQLLNITYLYMVLLCRYVSVTQKSGFIQYRSTGWIFKETYNISTAKKICESNHLFVYETIDKVGL